MYTKAEFDRLLSSLEDARGVAHRASEASKKAWDEVRALEADVRRVCPCDEQVVFKHMPYGSDTLGNLRSGGWNEFVCYICQRVLLTWDGNGLSDIDFAYGYTGTPRFKRQGEAGGLTVRDPYVRDLRKRLREL